MITHNQATISKNNADLSCPSPTQLLSINPISPVYPDHFESEPIRETIVTALVAKKEKQV